MPKDINPELVRLQNELKKADLADKQVASSGFSESTKPDSAKEKDDALRAESTDEYLPIRAFVDLTGLPAFEQVAEAHKADNQSFVEQAVDSALQLFAQAGILTSPPDWLLPVGFYHFLLNDFAAHRVSPNVVRQGVHALAKQKPGQVVMIPYEKIRQDGPAFMLKTTELFLQDLLTDHQVFAGAMLAHSCRQGGEVVPKAAAIQNINTWKSKWTKIVPIGFDPLDPFRAEDGSLYFRFGCAYQVTDDNGKLHEFDGPGICQLALENVSYKVVGFSMEGFEM